MIFGKFRLARRRSRRRSGPILDDLHEGEVFGEVLEHSSRDRDPRVEVEG